MKMLIALRFEHPRHRTEGTYQEIIKNANSGNFTIQFISRVLILGTCFPQRDTLATMCLTIDKLVV